MTYSLSGKEKEKRQFEGLLNAMDEFKDVKITILTHDEFDNRKIENREVVFIPVCFRLLVREGARGLQIWTNHS